MCQFFSFCTEPEGHGGKRYYFDWKYRKEHLADDNVDSHSFICEYYKLNEDVCNKYEFNPLTKVFNVDMVNSPVDDRIQAEDWVNKLDFKRVVEPLIIKPIVNPFDLPIIKVTEQDKQDLKLWNSVRASVLVSVRASLWASVGASVWASVRASLWASVWASVGDSVWDSVGDSVLDSVRASVGASLWASVLVSVRASVWAYISTFFAIEYEYDFSPAIRLWERGIVASFDGKTWRLHSGKKAEIIFEISKEELETL